LDWAGDPFDASRFHLEHGEDSYEQFLRHYDEYDDVACDTPLNLQSTTLGLNAYALGAGKGSAAGFWITPMRGWTARGPMAAYSPARSAMMARRPRLVGRHLWLEFCASGPADGQARGAQPGARAITAFFNALLLTGDREYFHVWRRLNALINAQARMVDGRMQTPTLFGPDGWHGWKAGPYRQGAFEIWYATQDPQDRAAAGSDPWISFLEGQSILP
jgi:hypothetical protein